MDWETILPWASLIVGILARLIVPFLVERIQNPDLGWDWVYVRGPALAFITLVLLLPLLVPDLAALGGLPYQAAWMVGWGIGDIGRDLDKTFSAFYSVRTRSRPK